MPHDVARQARQQFRDRSVYRSMTNRIRITKTMSHEWEWHLIMSDGHVAQASDRFATHEQCESDAIKQGLPVIGKRRPKKTAPADPENEDPTARWKFPSDRSGLWKWKRLNSQRQVIQESRCAFLTKAECVADACKNGYSKAGGEAVDE